MANNHSARIGILGLSGVLAAGGLVGLARPAVAASCPQVGTTVTCTFSNPAVAESFVVPPGVKSAQMTLQGGSGGNGAALVGGNPDADAGGLGAGGGITQATVALTPGATLRIFVGGQGGNGGGCDDQFTGTGGSSGGTKTGGDSGQGKGPPGNPAMCAGGGGGGGSFVMLADQSPSAITFTGGSSTGVTPLLAAGGGGGGGGGAVAGVTNDGGDGGGNTSGAAGKGKGDTGGGAGNTASAAGGAGADAGVPGQPRDAGGGGGGGFPGGSGGGTKAGAADGGNIPGSGGGGGKAYAGGVSSNEVPATLVPARVEGPVTYSVAAAGAPGLISISYQTSPGGGGDSSTDTDVCKAFDPQCVVQPPAGLKDQFKVRASGGNRAATLFGTLNGGTPPTCASFDGILSPDWVQFGFTSAKEGKTWKKRVRVSGRDHTNKKTALRLARQTEICFAAPYRFVVDEGTKLNRQVGASIFEGILADCTSERIRLAEQNRPKLARPCVIKRTLVHKKDGWVTRTYYRVPKSDEDPQGRTCRKKKRRH